MRSVRLRLQKEYFSAEMVEMRRWLDRNQYEPARFDCYQNDAEIILSVDFRREEAAEAFANRFDGEIVIGVSFVTAQNG
jgi:hypothetical protein